MIDALLRRELVEAAIDALPLIVIDIDTGVILHVTRPAEDLLGYGVRGDLINQSVSVLAVCDDKEPMAERARNYTADPVPVPLGQNGPAKLRKKDGQAIDVAIALTPIKLSDRRCVVAVALPLALTLAKG